MLRTHSLSYTITFIKNIKSTSFKAQLEEAKALILLQKGQSKAVLSCIQSIPAEQRFALTRYVFRIGKQLGMQKAMKSLHNQRYKEQDEKAENNTDSMGPRQV